MLKGCVLSLGQSQFAQAKKNSKRKTQKKGALACNHAASPTSNQDLYIIDNKYNVQDAVDIDAVVCNHSPQNMFILFLLVSGFSRVEEIFLASLQSWQLPEAVPVGHVGCGWFWRVTGWGAVPQFASLYVGDLHPDVTEAAVVSHASDWKYSLTLRNTHSYSLYICETLWNSIQVDTPWVQERTFETSPIHPIRHILYHFIISIKGELQNHVAQAVQWYQLYHFHRLEFRGNALRDLQLRGACSLDPCVPGQRVPQVSWSGILVKVRELDHLATKPLVASKFLRLWLCNLAARTWNEFAWNSFGSWYKRCYKVSIFIDGTLTSWDVPFLSVA